MNTGPPYRITASVEDGYVYITIPLGLATRRFMGRDDYELFNTTVREIARSSIEAYAHDPLDSHSFTTVEE